MEAIYPTQVITNRYYIKNYYRYCYFSSTLFSKPTIYYFSFSSEKEYNNKYLICG